MLDRDRRAARPARAPQPSSAARAQVEDKVVGAYAGVADEPAAATLVRGVAGYGARAAAREMRVEKATAEEVTLPSWA